MAGPYAGTQFRADNPNLPVVSYRSVSLQGSGIASDANLDKFSRTFGTDKGAAIQDILDLGRDGEPLTVHWDGRYSSSVSLIVWGQTHIIGYPTCGLIMRDNCQGPPFISGQCTLRPTNLKNRPVAASEYTGTPPAGVTTNGYDHDIVIEGMIINGNGFAKTGDPAVYADYELGGTGTSGYHQYNTNQPHHTDTYGWTTGPKFMGVRNLTLRNLRLINLRTFAAHFGDCENVRIDGVRVEQVTSTERPDADGNLDGLHFQRCTNVYITQLSGTTRDDMLALNAADYEQYLANTNPPAKPQDPFCGIGNITKLVADGIYPEGSNTIVRILTGNLGGNSPGGAMVDQVTIRNVFGTCKYAGFLLDRYIGTDSSNPLIGQGNIGSITFENINVSVSNSGASLFVVGQYARNLTIRNVVMAAVTGPLLSGSQSQAGVIQRLTLENIDADTTTGNLALATLSTGGVDTLRLSGVRADGFRSLYKAQGGLLTRVNHSGCVMTGGAAAGVLEVGNTTVGTISGSAMDAPAPYIVSGSGSVTTDLGYGQGSSDTPPDVVTALIPSDMTTATLLSWHEFTDAATVRTTGNTQAAIGNDVTAWNNKASGGINLAALGSGTKPTLTASGVKFAPAGQTVVLDATYGGAQAQRITIIAVMKPTAANATGVAFADPTRTSGDLEMFQDGGHWQIAQAGGSDAVISTAADDTSLHLHTAIFNNDTSFLYQDGVQVGTGTIGGTNGLGGIRLGATGSGAAPFSGTYAGYIVARGNLSTAERRGLEKYFQTTFNTPALPF